MSSDIPQNREFSSTKKRYSADVQLANVRQAFIRELGPTVGRVLTNSYAYYAISIIYAAILIFKICTTPVLHQLAYLIAGYALDQASFGLFHMHVHSLFIENALTGRDVTDMPSYAQAGYYHHYFFDVAAIHGIGVEMCMFGIVYGQPKLTFAWLMPLAIFDHQHTFDFFVYFFLFHSLQQPVHYWYHARGRRPLWFRTLEAVGIVNVQTHRVQHHGHGIDDLEGVNDFFDLNAAVPCLENISDWFWRRSSVFHVDGGQVRSKAFFNASALAFLLMMFLALWIMQELFCVFQDVDSAFSKTYIAMAYASTFFFVYLIIYSSVIYFSLWMSWLMEKRAKSKQTV